MQAPIEVSRREGEVFLLDILSHRMSEIGIFRQLSTVGYQNLLKQDDSPNSPSDFSCALQEFFLTMTDAAKAWASGSFGTFHYQSDSQKCWDST